jgi:ribonuclease BN (tRNA processing enzyme)
MTDLLFGEQGVYGPDIRARQLHESSLDVFRARGGTPPRKRPAPRVREIRPGDVVEGREWRVTVGRAAHVQPHLECLAFRLEGDGASVCYSGDSGPSEAIVALAKGCDVLIHMNHYFSGREPSAAYRAACGSHKDNAVIAAGADVKTLVFTHIVPELDDPANREAALREAREHFAGEIIWGEDLMTFKVGK